MSDKPPAVNVTTPVGLVSFPSVFQPAKPVNPGDAAKYSITLLIPYSERQSEPFVKLLAAINAVWKKGKKPIKKGEDENAKRVAEGKEPRPEYVGHYILTARNSDKPLVVDRVKVMTNGEMKWKVITEGDSDKFYAGCQARLSVQAFAYEKGVNQGVALSLQLVQWWGHGTPFRTRANAENDFGDIPGTPAAAGVSQVADPLDI